MVFFHGQTADDLDPARFQQGANSVGDDLPLQRRFAGDPKILVGNKPPQVKHVQIHQYFSGFYPTYGHFWYIYHYYSWIYPQICVKEMLFQHGKTFQKNQRLPSVKLKAVLKARCARRNHSELLAPFGKIHPMDVVGVFSWVSSKSTSKSLICRKKALKFVDSNFEKAPYSPFGQKTLSPSATAQLCWFVLVIVG